jgi:hypothetical protein
VKKTLSLLALCVFVGDGWSASTACDDETDSCFSNGTLVIRGSQELKTTNGWSGPTICDNRTDFYFSNGTLLIRGSQEPEITIGFGPLEHYNLHIDLMPAAVDPKEDLRNFWVKCKKAPELTFGNSEIEAAWKAVFAEFQAEAYAAE